MTHSVFAIALNCIVTGLILALEHLTIKHVHPLLRYGAGALAMYVPNTVVIVFWTHYPAEPLTTWTIALLWANALCSILTVGGLHLWDNWRDAEKRAAKAEGMVSTYERVVEVLQPTEEDHDAVTEGR